MGFTFQIWENLVSKRRQFLLKFFDWTVWLKQIIILNHFFKVTSARSQTVFPKIGGGDLESYLQISIDHLN